LAYELCSSPKENVKYCDLLLFIIKILEGKKLDILRSLNRAIQSNGLVYSILAETGNFRTGNIGYINVWYVKKDKNNNNKTF